MDKNDHMLNNDRNVNAHKGKRSRWLTLCMMATTASVIVLAGCGDNEEVAPPAEDTAPLEQNSTAEPAPGMNDPAMEQDPGLDGEATGQDTMTQPEGGMSEPETTMPEDTMDEPMDGTMEEDEAGFGEGTDPMPGANEDDEETTIN